MSSTDSEFLSSMIAGFGAFFASVTALSVLSDNSRKTLTAYDRQQSYHGAIAIAIGAVILWTVLLFIIRAIRGKRTLPRFLPHLIGWPAGVYFLCCIVILSRSDPQLLRAYETAVDDQVSAMDSWLDGFVDAASYPIEPPAKLSGEYLELATGPYISSQSFTRDHFVPIRNGLLYTLFSEYSEDYSYHRTDKAEYIVIIRTYATYNTSTDVKVTINGGAPYKGMERDTGCSVVVTVVDRQTKKVIARRDFPGPGAWRQNNSRVYFDRLAGVEEWLDGLGLKSATWLQRDRRTPRS